MIVGLWVGSKGTDEESFTVRIPINISPLSRITMTPGESPLNIEGHPAIFFEEHELNVLEVYGFSSEEVAREALPNIQAGLVYAALHHRIALPFPRQTAPVIYEEMPISGETKITRQFLEKGWDRLDGHYPWDYTVIKPEHKRLYIEAVGGGRLVPGIRDHDITNKMSEAMRLPHPEKVFTNGKLRLALNLYSSSFFQFDDSARFLTLVSVLETLNLSRPAADNVKDMIDEFVAQTRRVRDALDKNDPNSGYEDYNVLINRLGNLKTESIRQGIRSLVGETLRLDPDVDDPEAVAREAGSIYGLRSTLVHEGSIPAGDLTSSIERLMDIVSRVLLVMLREAAK